MPELVWDETDFVTCLETLPTIDEYEIGYHYLVGKDGLKLDLSVYPLAADICITIYRDGVNRPIINFTITNCGGTRYVRDDRGEYLEFARSQVLGDRFHRDFDIPVGVQLGVKPSISISLFAK